MLILKIILLFSFVFLSSSKQSQTKVKWCLEPKYVDADNKDVDKETCKYRPCIIGICPYGKIYYNKTCVHKDDKIFPEPLDYSNIFSIYKMKNDKPVNTGKTLDNNKYQIVRFKNPKSFLQNSCTTSFHPLEENDGHFLEDGSFFLTYDRIILPPEEYIIWIVANNKTGTWRLQLYIKFGKEEPISEEDILFDLYSLYAMLVSVIFIILLLIVYSLCKELRSTAGLVLMTYTTELAIVNLLIVIRDLSSYNKVILLGYPCYVISTLIHFFMFSSYFWMTIMSFDIWWTLRKMYYGTGGKRGVNYVKFIRYCCIATLPPLIYVIIEVCLDEFTDYGPRFILCTANSNPWYQAGVTLSLPTLNFIPFVLTMYNLWRINRSTQAQLNNGDSGNTGPAKQNAFLCIKISVMMGTNWFLDVIIMFFYEDLPGWFKYTAKMYNSLFGVILFLVYIIKWDVLLKLFRRLSIDNGITRKLERRVSRQQSSYKSRKWSQQSNSTGITDVQAVNSQPSTEVD